MPGSSVRRMWENVCVDWAMVFCRYVFESAMPVGRLVRKIADKSQRCTQYSWNRPYGVGLLVAGSDKAGPALMQTCPSGNYYEYNAYAIGLRSQAARTYLEKTFDRFGECDVDGLIQHALKAIDASMQDGELTKDNCTVAIVGKDMPFTILESQQLPSR